MKPSTKKETATKADGPDETPVSPTPVRVGQVDGLHQRMPVAELQDILAASAERIDWLRSTRSVLDLQERVRATDGECAPVYFTQRSEESPTLFSGLEGFAAGLAIGLNSYPVVIIDAGDAGAAQAFLVSQANSKAHSNKPASPA